MALKFRRLSAPQASRHRVVNSTDLTSSQSSDERRDAVGQCGHDAGRHSHLQLDTISRLKRHPFLYTGFESGVETDIALLRVLQEHEFERVGETESIRESKIRSLRINKKRFKTTNPSADLISILSSANPRAQFRDFANVAKTRNLDVRQATWF